MNSKKYWEKRTDREAYEMYEDAEKVAEELKKAYFGASAYLQRQAEGLFEKFRQKYGLSDAEARRLLNSLHDSTSINELMQKLRTCEQTDDIKELRKHIEAAAYGARLRRMAGIQDSIDRLMKRLFGKTVKLASDWLQKLAGESYYKHMFELCKRTGFLLKFNGLSERAIMKLLKTKWLGGDFSSRLWENTKRLAEKLKEELLVSMLTGRTDRETANVINDEFRKGASAARRLVRTESNHVYTEARFIGTEECGIEEYIFLATLDLRTSKICRSLDGKRFKVKDRKVGTNCPPMHPWCRSTTLDYFGEEWLKNGTRSALDPVTGRRIKVPMSMTYKEWYDKYVKGHEKEMAEKQPQSRNLTREQYDRYRRRGVGPDSYEEFIKLKGDPEAWAKLQEEYRKAGKDGKAATLEKKVAVPEETKAAEVFVEPEKVEEDVYKDQKIQSKIANSSKDRWVNQAEKYRDLADKAENPLLRMAYIRQAELMEQFHEERQLNRMFRKVRFKDGAPLMRFIDITNAWFPGVTPRSHSVIRLQSYVKDGHEYIVDNFHVKMHPSTNEIRIAELLREKIGGEIYHVPKVEYPEGIRTPDYIFNGKEYDLKTITGSGKSTLVDAIKRKKGQSNSFIFDLTSSALTSEDVEKQIEKIYRDRHTAFVDEVVIIRGNNIEKVYKKA